MIRAAILVGMVSACAQVQAASPLIPPDRYDFPPPMPVREVVIDGASAYRHCAEVWGPFIRRDAAGCQYFDTDGACVVVYAKRSPRAFWRDIRRHELAHCNGWDH